MIGFDRFVDDFRSLGWTVDGPFESGGHHWAILRRFHVPAGRYMGQIIDVAIPAPGDFPATPPGGLYVSPLLVPANEMAGLSVHDRAAETAGIPGSWQYWSRPVPPGTWQPTRAARRLINHWNAVMSNVN